MSRHEIEARDPRHRIVVGWDHPLRTFFVQVIDRAEQQRGGDDYMIHWVGGSLRELYEVDDLRRAIARYGDLTAELAATLYGDKDEGL